MHEYSGLPQARGARVLPTINFLKCGTHEALERSQMRDETQGGAEVTQIGYSWDLQRSRSYNS